jgi:connector enhancer of kinase suppressor of Ras 2
MAYVNVMEWKAEQVAEWLRGLDDVVYPYAHFFLNNDVTGQGLLNLTVDDLYKLHVEKLGHQEIILESLDLLRNFHFHLDQENLQFVCLRLSCKARSLYHEIMARYPPPCAADTAAAAGRKQQEVSAPMMSAVADVLDAVRLLLSWLDRRPFDSKSEFHRVRTTLIGLSLELATNAQRDTFAEQPVDVIRSVPLLFIGIVYLYRSVLDRLAVTVGFLCFSSGVPLLTPPFLQKLAPAFLCTGAVPVPVYLEKVLSLHSATSNV